MLKQSYVRIRVKYNFKVGTFENSSTLENMGHIDNASAKTNPEGNRTSVIQEYRDYHVISLSQT
jgi:hypothetical protein